MAISACSIDSMFGLWLLLSMSLPVIVYIYELSMRKFSQQITISALRLIACPDSVDDGGSVEID